MGHFSLLNHAIYSVAFCLITFFISLPQASHASEDWGLCNIPIIKKSNKQSNIDSPTFVESDELTVTNRDFLTFKGNVSLTQSSSSIAADQLYYDNNSGILSSETPSVFTSPNSQIQSQAFRFDSDTESGQFWHTDIQVLETHRFIQAEQLIQLNQDERQFKNFQYSSCEPGDNTWKLSSHDIKLNYKTGLGIAKHAKIYLFDAPIFYFPYFQFPIDNKRHSGLLMPSFSYAKTEGLTINTPIYWNIHPQFDMTFDLTNYAKRGLQINAETRYLLENHQGQLITSNIDDDLTNTHRSYFKLTHSATLPAAIKLDLQTQKTNDVNFFDDFTTLENSQSVNYLPSSLSLSHSTTYWATQLLWQDYQIIEESLTTSETPYAHWPKFTTTGNYTIFDNTTALNIPLNFTNFKKDNSVIGERFILNPSMSRKWSNHYAYIKPSFGLYLSQYNLKNIDNTSDNYSLSLSTFSLDSGLFFERIASEKNAWLQTLEPRLFFTQTPYKAQNHIPIFDTGDLAPSYNNLFLSNRFSGYDRIGDTQQLTIGLSTSLLSLNSGNELLRFSVGKTLYAKDRFVQLNGTSINSEKVSDLFTELTIQPNDFWKFTANITQQTNTHFLSEKNINATYKDNGQVINLGYRFKGEPTATTLEQIDISTVYPINERWNIFAKRQYSLFKEQTVEQLLGASYDSCCWSFSVMLQQQSDENFILEDKTIFFQFDLKGLSSIGRNNNKLLQKSIPGYQY